MFHWNVQLCVIRIAVKVTIMFSNNIPKRLLTLSLFSLLSEACLRTTWPDNFLQSPVHLVVLLLQFQLFCMWLWNHDLFTGRATLSRTCSFDSLSLTHLLSLTLNSRLWKDNWHLLLWCRHVAPSTTTVIIIIWPCWSSMNVWTSWPCTVIIAWRCALLSTPLSNGCGWNSWVH